jgi:hypothetical protein
MANITPYFQFPVVDLYSKKMEENLQTIVNAVNTQNFTTNASIAAGTTVKEYVAGTDYRVGLKDASGVNGSMFIKDASIYLKINNFWTMMACVSIGLG